ncbi:MAG: putative effector of murein hydrolase [Sulfurimonas sp.]|jgi:putative effector of murein hydrolase
MNIDALLLYINTSPLPWLIFTIGSYKIGLYVYKKSNQYALLQPIIVAYAIMLPLLLLSGVSYEHYFKSTTLIHFFLGAATVALAVPLFNNLKHIYSHFVPLIITLVFGGILTAISAVGILYMFDASSVTMLSMSTRSVTAPITIIIAEDIGANPSLAIGFVLITALLGALFSDLVIRLMRIKHDAAKGFALGLVSHAVGVAKSMEISQKAAAFAALAMGLYGVCAAIILPLIVMYW